MSRYIGHEHCCMPAGMQAPAAECITSAEVCTAACLQAARALLSTAAALHAAALFAACLQKAAGRAPEDQRSSSTGFACSCQTYKQPSICDCRHAAVFRPCVNAQDWAVVPMWVMRPLQHVGHAAVPTSANELSMFAQPIVQQVVVLTRLTNAGEPTWSRQAHRAATT